MKVIICGAGQVGTSIAAYLAEEGNSVTLVDQSAELIAHVNDTLDVSGIVGHASHPDVLEQAGAGDAEMIIAATYSDEVNMLACQVAHALFDVPRKIARVRDQSYLNPIWSDLFTHDHLPIDAIISPEVEVARAILNRIRVPGAFNIIPLAEGRVQMVSVICHSDCPLVNTPLQHLTALFPDLMVEVVAIVRGEENIIPSSDDHMQAGDEVYFVTSADHLSRVMLAFGYEEPLARSILIVGAGKIGLKLAQDLHNQMPHVSVRIVESDPARARVVAETLESATVIQGDGLNREIMDQASNGAFEAVIAVTNHDENNVLLSLLAKQRGCEQAITLINNSSYIPLVSSLGVDALVNPRSITVSTILQHIRRGRVRAAHTLRDGFAEIMELEALETSAAVNLPIQSINRPRGVVFGAIVRGDLIFMPRPDTVIRAGDRVIVVAAHDQVKKVEQLFAVRPEFF